MGEKREGVAATYGIDLKSAKNKEKGGRRDLNGRRE